MFSLCCPEDDFEILIKTSYWTFATKYFTPVLSWQIYSQQTNAVSLLTPYISYFRPEPYASASRVRQIFVHETFVFGG